MLRIVGILCFAESAQDPVMFYRYGDKHLGMVLKFKCEGFLENVEKVAYGEELPVVDFFDNSNNAAQFEKTFTKKFIDWQYEKEWRYIEYNEVDSPIVRSRAYPPELLEGVIFGYLMPQADRDYAVNLLRTRGYAVALYEAKLNAERSLLDIVPYVSPPTR